MPALVILSGSFGKGTARYEGECFLLPNDESRPVEEVVAIDVHGAVNAGHDRGWTNDVLRGLKGGLSLASSLELTGGLALAASLAGAGLTAMDSEKPDAPRAIMEITFRDGSQVLALAAEALPALIRHDRDVVQRAFSRFSTETSTSLLAAPDPKGGLLDGARASASDAVDAVSDAANSVLNSAWSMMRRQKG